MDIDVQLALIRAAKDIVVAAITNDRRTLVITAKATSYLEKEFENASKVK